MASPIAHAIDVIFAATGLHALHIRAADLLSRTLIIVGTEGDAYTISTGPSIEAIIVACADEWFHTASSYAVLCALTVRGITAGARHDTLAAPFVTHRIVLA